MCAPYTRKVLHFKFDRAQHLKLVKRRKLRQHILGHFSEYFRERATRWLRVEGRVTNSSLLQRLQIVDQAISTHTKPGRDRSKREVGGLFKFQKEALEEWF